MDGDFYSLDDIAVELGKASAADLSAAQTAQAKLWAQDVLAEIAVRAAPRTLAELDAATLARVVRVAVAERATQPQRGATMVEVAVDDARTVRQYSTSAASDSLMRDPWWSWLGLDGSDDVAGGRSFSISPAYAPDAPARPVGVLDYRRRMGWW